MALKKGGLATINRRAICCQASAIILRSPPQCTYFVVSGWGSPWYILSLTGIGEEIPALTRPVNRIIPKHPDGQSTPGTEIALEQHGDCNEIALGQH